MKFSTFLPAWAKQKPAEPLPPPPHHSATYEDIHNAWKSIKDAIHHSTESEPIMSTAPATPKTNEDKVLTFLQHAGSVLKNILHIGEAVASVAEPMVDLAFPEVAPLYNSALGLAMSAEATAPTLTGTGPQKLSQLTANLVPQAQAWAEQNGIKWDNGEINKWASAVVDTLNMIPSPTTVTTGK